MEKLERRRGGPVVLIMPEGASEAEQDAYVAEKLKDKGLSADSKVVRLHACADEI